MTATSARVRHARRLRDRTERAGRRQFLVEGPQSVREALAVDECVHELFVTEQALDRHADIGRLIADRDITVHLSREGAIDSLAGSVSPQGIVAVCAFVDVSLDEAISGPADGPRLVAVAASVRDPGNAGTLIRCADAAGATAVALAGTSVDVYNDKTVRSSVGSIFHLPIVVGTSVATAITTLRGQGFAVLAADGSAQRTLDDLADSGGLEGSVAWVFGNEAWGLPAEDAAMCDESVAVPIYGRAESLNVATAAAVCLYTTARAQRGGRSG